MKLKIKFWDTERQFFLESAISCVTAFRNYMDIPAETRFSDCPNQPEKMRYIPVLHTLISDFWEGDIVELYLGTFWDDELFRGAFCRCIIEFDEKFGWWAIRPFIPIKGFDGFMLSGAIGHIKKIGNKFENPQLMNEAVLN